MDKNYVLPETEKSLNLIITKIKRTFDISSLCFTGFYAAYTISRIFFLPNLLILNIVLSFISWTMFILDLLEFSYKIHLNQKTHLAFEIIKRVVCFSIFILVFISLFSSINSEMLPYRVLLTMGCGIGNFISIVGDIFNATIPAWTQIVLNSFKADIEITGLTERSLDKFNEELKKDEFKNKIASSAIHAGSSIVRGVFKNLFKGKNEQLDK